ncbi:KH domain-containing protein [Myxococcota bacterium]
MEKLVEYIAKALVEDPEQVVVETVRDTDTEQVIELRVAPDDRGRVIGKNGRTAHAMRTLLSAASPEYRTVNLEIVD